MSYITDKWIRQFEIVKVTIGKGFVKQFAGFGRYYIQPVQRTQRQMRKGGRCSKADDC